MKTRSIRWDSGPPPDSPLTRITVSPHLRFVALRSLVTVSLVAALLSLGAVAAPTAGAAELDVPHTTLVPEVPRIDFPQILDGDVYAVEQIGNWIVSGGDFTQIELSDGTIVDQPYLVAFDIDTGELVTSFAPVLDGQVFAIAEGNPGEIYLGGAFNRVNDKARRKLVKLHSDGNVVSGWVAHASSAVHDIDITDTGRLFVGGSFKKLDGADVEVVGEVDPTNGQVIADFSFDFEGEGGWFSGGQSTRHVEALPGGNELLVVHSAESIDGNLRKAAAIFDISDQQNPVLSNYSINAFFEGARYGALPTNGDLSPDGSFFAISTSIGDNPPWHDMILTFPTGDQPDTMPMWTHAMRDSVFAVGVSNNAVYAGGHFCHVDDGPGETVEGNFTDVRCSGIFRSDGIYRWQIAALDVADGTPLNWDPGSSAGRGVQELTVTDRGLLVGHDGVRLGGRNVGRTGFFDFGAASLDNQAPVVGIETPTAGEVVESPFTVSGTTSDNQRVLSVKVRLQSNTTGQWLQGDATLGATAYDFTVPVNTHPGVVTPWSIDIVAPDDQFRVEARAIDSAGLVSNQPQFSFGVGMIPHPTCVASVTADGAVALTWTALDGEDTYSVRRDGNFLASTGQTSYTDTAPIAGATHDYVIRSFDGGVTTDLDCGSVTIDAEPAPTCTLALEADGSVRAEWTAVPGEDTYIIRRNGAFYGAVINQLTYTDTEPAEGTNTYVIRSTQGGVQTNTECGEITIDPPAAPTCTLTAQADGTVLISWSALEGEDKYFVRRDGNFVAAVLNNTSYVDAPEPGTSSYVIRSFRQGVGQTDVDCGAITL